MRKFVDGAPVQRRNEALAQKAEERADMKKAVRAGYEPTNRAERRMVRTGVGSIPRFSSPEQAQRWLDKQSRKAEREAKKPRAPRCHVRLTPDGEYLPGDLYQGPDGRVWRAERVHDGTIAWVEFL